MSLYSIKFLFGIILITFTFQARSSNIILDPSIVKAPSIENLPVGKEGEEIRYGFELLSNTAKYLGPKGSVSSNTKTRMSCSNCHMDVGRKDFGNSWLDSHGSYPQYRSREGFVITLAERANLCFTHPMNGKPLPLDSREMRAILLYYKWLGVNRPILSKDKDNRLVKLPFLDRAADPKKGALLFKTHCLVCHGENGQGTLLTDKKSYSIPPLWGKESYQMGSSFSRVSVLARFIKANMPYGATAVSPILVDEEAWDVAAFINSKSRPMWSGKLPYPRLYEKTYDFPIGPYADPFTPTQHKYGPYKPIINYWDADLDVGDITNIFSQEHIILSAQFPKK
ncbi:MAG: c-type cytochrome [Bacteriovorax sp.]|nr:c-type cytochrome [Bacteriovorax sp.]